MTLSRRDFGRLALGSSAAATLGTLGLTSALAQSQPDYRAVVTIFLYGGNDGWNTLVPMDERHAAYTQLRGPSVALFKEDLAPLPGTNFGMHPSFAPLVPLWNQGAMSWVLNVGTLLRPLTREQFWEHPEWRPSNLSSHSDEQAHWQSMRPGSVHPDGVLGRMADTLLRAGEPAPAASRLISTNGANLALMGNQASPLILPLYSPFDRTGYDPDTTNPAEVARNAALKAFADGPHPSKVQELTAKGFEDSYKAGVQVNPILRGEGTAVDQDFNDPDGSFRDTQLSRQMRLIARMIEKRGDLSHNRQLFYAGQGDYDTHANQVAGGRVLGAHADLLTDVALSITSFYAAMQRLGLSDKVTIVTMSDFGRTFKGNGSNGTDHGWGNAYFVVGGALKPQTIHGLYPRLAFGTGDDSEHEGTWIPTISNEEYFGAVAQWFGVPSDRMSYVLPNWSNWSTNGRGPVPLFG